MLRDFELGHHELDFDFMGFDGISGKFWDLIGFRYKVVPQFVSVQLVYKYYNVWVDEWGLYL